MVQIDESDVAALTKAVRVWTGWGHCTFPRRDNAAVVSALDAVEAGRQIPVLKDLEQEFYSTNARLVAADLSEMGEIAVAQFRAKYPALPAQIAEAFAWCYTFDFR